MEVEKIRSDLKFVKQSLQNMNFEDFEHILVKRHAQIQEEPRIFHEKQFHKVHFSRKS